MAVGLMSIDFGWITLKTKSIMHFILASGEKKLPASHKVPLLDFVSDSLVQVGII